jgi:spore germination protein (amino acid permease)
VVTEGNVTREQAVCLTFGSAMGSIIYTFTWAITITGRPFWIAVLLGVLCNIPFAVWILYLCKCHKGSTIFDLLVTGLGKFISAIMIFIYILINIAAAVCLLNIFTGTIKVFFLHRTPASIIMLFIVIICALFANSGITNIGRLAEILITLAIINFFSCFTLSFVNSFDFQNTLPMFDTSLSQLAKGILVTAGITSECLLFFMILSGSIPEPMKHKMWVVNGLVGWSVVLSSAVFIMEGVLSPELLARIAHAGVNTARVVQIGEFVRGLEVLVLATYQYCTIMKILIFMYSCQVAANKLFRNSNRKFFIILFAFIIFAASAYVNSYNTGYFLSLFLGTFILLPFVILVLMLATLSLVIINKRNRRTAK